MKKTFGFCMAVALACVGATLFQPQEADAQGRRPDVRQMTCDQARDLVRQAGGIVLTTGQYTYDRYVSDRMYCPTGLDIKDAWVATSDTQSCRIGYRCVTEPRFPWPSWRD